MEQTMVSVHIDDKTVEVPYGTRLGELAEKYYDTVHVHPALLARTDGKLRELHKRIKKPCTVSFLSIEDPIGHKTYKRSMNLLFLRAVYRVLGRERIEKVVLHFAIGDGFFYTVQGDVRIDRALLEKIKADMLRMVDQEIPVMKRSENTADAVELFHQYGMYDKEKLFSYRRVSRVNMYSLEDFEDYFYGFMVWHTGYLKLFDLVPYEDGVVLMMPGEGNPDMVQPFVPSPKIFSTQRQAEEWAGRMGASTVGELNEQISQGRGTELYLVSEALQEGKISRIAEEIAGRDKVKFVMIAGPSSSGKTTFSRRLSIQLIAHGMHPHAISADNYFHNRQDTPRDEKGDYDFECLGAVDTELFNSDMTRLLNGEEVELPSFNFLTGKREYRGQKLQMGQGDVLVIEGIHCLNDAFSHALPRENKYKIYVSALTQLNIDEHNRIPTTDGRLLRRIVRDNRTRGNTAKDTIARWSSVRRGEQQNIFPFQEEADAMFNSALLYELAVLKIHAQPLLFQITKDDPEYDEAVRLLKFLDYFLTMPGEPVAKNSILREFIGGSCFDV